jgi:hypothetical protein
LIATNFPVRFDASCSPRARTSLPVPAFAEQQRGDVARRDLLDRAADAQHLRIARDEFCKRVGVLQRLQAAVLRLQLRKTVRAIDRQPEKVRVERLGEEVVGAERDGAQGVRLVVLPGEDDDLDVGVELQQLLQQLETLRDRIRVGRQPQVHRHDRQANGGGIG